MHTLCWYCKYLLPITLLYTLILLNKKHILFCLTKNSFFLNFCANFPFFSRIRLQSRSLRGRSVKPYFRSINGPCFKTHPCHILEFPLMFSIKRSDEFQNMQFLFINLKKVNIKLDKQMNYLTAILTERGMDGHKQVWCRVMGLKCSVLGWKTKKKFY